MKSGLPLLVLGLGMAMSLAGGPATKPSAEGVEFFEKNIRPVLAERCYRCHSADAEKIKGGLVLDTREGLLKGGDNGVVIVPGKPEKNRLITAGMVKDGEDGGPPEGALAGERSRAFRGWGRVGGAGARGGGGVWEVGAAAYGFWRGGEA